MNPHHADPHAPDAAQHMKPLDPGRVNTMDPAELRYWCHELHCSEARLQEVVAEVGEHVTAVRAQLARH